MNKVNCQSCGQSFYGHVDSSGVCPLCKSPVSLGDREASEGTEVVAAGLVQRGSMPTAATRVLALLVALEALVVIIAMAMAVGPGLLVWGLVVGLPGVVSSGLLLSGRGRAVSWFLCVALSLLLHFAVASFLWGEVKGQYAQTTGAQYYTIREHVWAEVTGNNPSRRAYESDLMYGVVTALHGLIAFGLLLNSPGNWVRPAVGRRTSRVAVASLAMAVLYVPSMLAFAVQLWGLTFFCGVLFAGVALALGLMAWVRCTRNRNRLQGRPLAILGVFLAGVSLLVVGGRFVNVSSRARAEVKCISCARNMQVIGLSLIAYYNESGVWPTASAWREVVRERSPDVSFQCPSARSDACCYAINPSPTRSSRVTVSRAVLVFEITPGSDGSDLIGAAAFRHRGGSAMNVVWGDGHVEVMTRSQFESLDWTVPGTTPAERR